MRELKRPWFAVALLCLAITLAVSVRGCGTSGPAVSGTVSVDGELLTSGSIRFVPLADTPGSDAGASIAKGKYRIPKGLTVGIYAVEIQGTGKHPERMVLEPMGIDWIPDEVQVVPPEYHRNSKLTHTVELGQNTLDFKLNGFQSEPAGAARRTANN